MSCKYWDCGWCYAPENVETNAVQGECIFPECCPYLMQNITPMTEKEHLECEIQELELELEKKGTGLRNLINILSRKQQKLKEMNDSHRNTNEAVENKLQNHNWKVEVMNAIYPMLEVIDENTVKIEGVEYKKVENPKPQTLYDIIREWNDDDDNPPCEILLDMIEEWMSQYQCDYVVCAEYLQGYNALMETLKANLK